jgi:20S proteasome alpha/beta subunit
MFITFGKKIFLIQKATNGIVIATEKKLSSVLVDETSVDKISQVNEHIGVVYRSSVNYLCFI